MKTGLVALLVVLVVSHSDALRCYCGGKKICSSNRETCYGSNQVCASITFTGPSVGYFQGCYSAQECEMLRNSPFSTGYCCYVYLCNRK